MNNLNTNRQNKHSPEDEALKNGEPESHQPPKPNVLQIVFSTFAAAFGVQSNKNRARDFGGGSLMTYIISGVVFTFVFVLVMLLVVRLVLASSGL